MRWIIYGDILSRHAIDSLVSALRAAGHEVVAVPSVARGQLFRPDPDTEAASRRKIDAALPADVLFNFNPEELTPGQIRDLRRDGVMTLTWFRDDPLLYRVCYRHVVEAYDLVLHSAREDVLAFYEERHGTRGYSFPFWADDTHFPYAYDPDAADIEVGFLGNCHMHRRRERYDLLADLPWLTRFYGRMPRGSAASASDDYAGIHGGVLEPDEIPTTVRRFRVAVNMAQQFTDVEDHYDFPDLAGFGEYFFPSRLPIYAAVGVPTVSLTIPGLAPPFPSLTTATERGELIDRIGALLDDRDTLVDASRRTRRDFEAFLTAESRVAMLASLLEEPGDHDLATRAELWRTFAPAKTPPGQEGLAPMSGDRITELYDGEIGVHITQVRARERIHWMCGQVTGDDVLDVGCSQGVVALLLAREGKRVVGVDVDSAALEFARERLERESPAVQERIEFLEADAGELPFEDASFDTVVLGEVLEHLIDPGRVVADAARVLRPGGRAVITVPYGIFRSDDHKEPIYLEPLMEVVGADLELAKLELVNHYVGLVAIRSGEGAGLSIWQQALEVAEERLRDRDEHVDELEISLKRQKVSLERTLTLQGHLDAVRGERAKLQDELFKQSARLEREKRLVEELRNKRAVRLARWAWRVRMRVLHPFRGSGRRGPTRN